MQINLISYLMKEKAMKKVVTAALLSVSLLVVPFAQVQAQTQAQVQTYAGNIQGANGTDMHPNTPHWLLLGVIYWALSKALDVAWEEINKGSTSSGFHEACEFIEENDGNSPAECAEWNY